MGRVLIVAAVLCLMPKAADAGFIREARERAAERRAERRVGAVILRPFAAVAVVRAAAGGCAGGACPR